MRRRGQRRGNASEAGFVEVEVEVEAVEDARGTRRKPENHRALLQLACGLITWRMATNEALSLYDDARCS